MSPFTVKNIRLFILFRVFFNARFYYPVFTILFVDFGLSVAQFALLNAVWAGTIVLLEVPSGALADIIGRRKLLRFTGWLMVFEIALITFAPRQNPALLFAIFFVNRILSGTAEAAASGADEALAYDSLKEAGLEYHWDNVLEAQMRWQSVAFIVSMLIGALVYDPAVMQTLGDLLGMEIAFTQDVTLRYPLYLTLAMALITLVITYKFNDADGDEVADDANCLEVETCTSSIGQTFRTTWRAGLWILHTPFALVVISAGFVFDGIIRMVITLTSQYYRVIALPEATYGVIGAGLALLGLVIPRIARYMSRQKTPFYNLMVMTALTLIGLVGMNLFIPYWGLIPAVILFSTMYFNGFFVSNYLNRMAESRQRATVLSFKGLAYNLTYGLIGIGYSILVAVMRAKVDGSQNGISAEQVENMVFVESFVWFPWAFVIAMGIFLPFAVWQLRDGLPAVIKNPK
jgi:MFS family permease